MKGKIKQVYHKTKIPNSQKKKKKVNVEIEDLKTVTEH